MMTMIKLFVVGLAGLTTTVPLSAQCITEPERWHGSTQQDFDVRLEALAHRLAEEPSEMVWKDSSRIETLLDVAAASANEAAVCAAMKTAINAYTFRDILDLDWGERSESLWVEDDGFRLREKRLAACVSAFGVASRDAFEARHELAKFSIAMGRSEDARLLLNGLQQRPTAVSTDEELDVEITMAQLAALLGDLEGAIARLKSRAAEHPASYAGGKGAALRIALAEMLRTVGRGREANEHSSSFVQVVESELERLAQITETKETAAQTESETLAAVLAFEQLGALEAQDRWLARREQMLSAAVQLVANVRPVSANFTDAVRIAKAPLAFVQLLRVRNRRLRAELSGADAAMAAVEETIRDLPSAYRPNRFVAVEQGFAAQRRGDLKRALNRFLTDRHGYAGPNSDLAKRIETEVYAAIRAAARAQPGVPGREDARSLLERNLAYSVRTRLKRAERRASRGQFVLAGADADLALADARRSELGEGVTSALDTQALIAAYTYETGRFEPLRRELAAAGSEEARASLCVIDVYEAVLAGIDSEGMETPACGSQQLHVEDFDQRLELSHKIGLGRVRAGTGQALMQLRHTYAMALASGRRDLGIGAINSPNTSSTYALDLVDRV